MAIRFDLGRDFSASTAKDKQELELHVRRLKYFERLFALGPRIDECLVQIKNPLRTLLDECSGKDRRMLQGAGIFSDNDQVYCKAARLLIDIVTRDAQDKIARIVPQMNRKIEREIEIAERNFAELSPWHQDLLNTMRSKPN